MFTKDVKNNGIITPEYPCGSKGPTVDVHFHGVNYSAHKLVDDFHKHVSDDRKKVCEACDSYIKEQVKKIKPLKVIYD